MTQEEFDQLRTGDVVRGMLSSAAYVVHAHYGDHVIALRLAYISHPDEWELIGKARHALDMFDASDSNGC
jgi:hypothetical protein